MTPRGFTPSGSSTPWPAKPGIKRHTHPETALHIAVADFLKLALPPNVKWTTVAHGGFEIPKRTADKLKAMGLQKGWPDIQAIHPNTGVYFGIELKSDTGRLSPDQKAMHAALEASRAHVAVCRSVDEVEGTLRGWGFPLMASVRGRAA